MSMFRGLGRGHFAVGLAAGVSVTTLLFVWIISWLGDPSNQKECTYDQAANNCKEAQNLTGFKFSEFIYVTPSDTLAQWIMATLAVFATVISIWAVLLIRQTLKATSKTLDAANETNEIMRNEQRPWVLFETIQYGKSSNVSRGNEQFPEAIPITIIFKNFGKTPAFNVGIMREGFSIPMEKNVDEVEFTPIPTGMGTGVVGPNSETQAQGMAIVGDEYDRFLRRETKFVAHGMVMYGGAATGEQRETEVVAVLTYNGERSNGDFNIDIMIHGFRNRAT